MSKDSLCHICIRNVFLFAILCIAVGIGNASFGSNSAADDAVQVKTAWSADGVHPGGSMQLAVVVDIKPGFHINADERQIEQLEDFKPIPTKLSVVEAPDSITFEAPRYPKALPFKAQYAPSELMTYTGLIS